jgi:hypothetical protein
MNIYHISQGINTGYDTYDSAIVIAPDEESAKRMHPNGKDTIPIAPEYHSFDWTNDPNNVKAEQIGLALPDDDCQRVVCSSFNAG